MIKRNVLVVLILPIITFGIYAIVWYVSTKDEMNTRDVEKVTNGTNGAFGNFMVRLFLGPIGMAITQSAFNRVAA